MKTGVNMAEIKQLADKLKAGQLNEARLACDATDCAPKVTIRSEQQRVEWGGQHDLSSTGIADKCDQTPYIAQHQQRYSPLLQGLEANQPLQYVLGDGHASACFSCNKLGHDLQLASACFE